MTKHFHRKLSVFYTNASLSQSIVGAEEEGKQAGHCRQYMLALLRPSAYRREPTAADKDSAGSSLTLPLAGPLNNSASDCKRPGLIPFGWRLPHSETRRMFGWWRMIERETKGGVEKYRVYREDGHRHLLHLHLLPRHQQKILVRAQMYSSPLSVRRLLHHW